MGTGQLEILAPMVFAVILTLTIGGVILLKPIANKLGFLLEAMAKERQEPKLTEELGHIRELLETMNGRLSLLEERQDFTDALLSDPDRRRMRLKGPTEGLSGE
jgi:hypothetical protein